MLTVWMSSPSMCKWSFGFLLAALAVQLALKGLEDLGLIHLGGH